MTHPAWLETVPEVTRTGSLRRVEAFRLGFFLSNRVWEDAAILLHDRRTWGVADQVYRAAGTISSNVADGYSRGTGKDRARFEEHGLGSARESRDRYYIACAVRPPEVVSHRLARLTQLTRLSITLVANERRTNRRIRGR